MGQDHCQFLTLVVVNLMNTAVLIIPSVILPSYPAFTINILATSKGVTFNEEVSEGISEPE